MKTSEIIEEALRLTIDERVKIVEAILKSMNRYESEFVKNLESTTPGGLPSLSMNKANCFSKQDVLFEALRVYP